jgi:hypothetical protein
VVLLTIVLLAVGLISSEDAGLVSSLLAGLLLAPYTLVYSATILLLAVRHALRVGRWRTSLLALVANPVLIAVPTLWLATALITMSRSRPTAREA